MYVSTLNAELAIFYVCTLKAEYKTSVGPWLFSDQNTDNQICNWSFMLTNI